MARRTPWVSSVYTARRKSKGTIVTLWSKIRLVWQCISQLKNAWKSLIFGNPINTNWIFKWDHFGQLWLTGSGIVGAQSAPRPGFERGTFSLLCQFAKNVAQSKWRLGRQLWLDIFSRSLDLGIHTVPHLKDLINICLEPEAQGHCLTFSPLFTMSKYLQIIS